METLIPNGFGLTPYGKWIVAEAAKRITVDDSGVGRSEYDGPLLSGYVDGVIVTSLVPFGQLAWLVHFQDDQSRVYGVFMKPDDDPVRLARLWRETH